MPLPCRAVKLDDGLCGKLWRSDESSGYIHLVDTSEQETVRITAGQLVALNMARWRKAAGISQAQLGTVLGWSDKTVSAAERTRDGDGLRSRKFGAADIVAIAIALGVPVAALFLPPAEDGAGVQYTLALGTLDASMAEVFGLLLPDAAEDSPAQVEWDEAFQVAVGRYADPELGADILARMEDITSDERRRIQLERIRWQREALLATASDLGLVAEAMEREQEEGR